MGVQIWENKLAIITRHTAFVFDLIKDVDKTLDHEIDFIIKRNKTLAGHFSYLTIIDKYNHRNEIQVNEKQ